MTIETDLKRLLRTATRIEQKLKDTDRKADHILFTLNEDRRCFTRRCPLDDDTDKNHTKK